MAAVALKDGSSSVACTDGIIGSACGKTPHHWDTKSTQASDAGSTDVFVNNIGVVREDDAMASHPDGEPCVASPKNHAPTLSTYSSTVYVNNKHIGRIGDKYNSDGHYDHEITTGSADVFAG